MEFQRTRGRSVRTFYSPHQALPKQEESNFSRSPEKPRLLMEKIKKEGLAEFFEIIDQFPPLRREDFLLAHTPRYVDAFLSGERPLCESNHLKWSPELVNAVMYQNASLYEAIRASIKNPSQVCFSPTSGFHHAQPEKGAGFCTMSGQVIAAIRLYREFGLSGAFIDLDGHFGNSIEDSRAFVPELNKAIPKGCNVNPEDCGDLFIEDFKTRLEHLRQRILSGEIGYVVFCHGADSHEDDDIGGGQCSTEQWVECSKIFYQWVKEIDSQRKDQLPVALSLFGGYRADDYESVLSLHLADLAICLRTLCEVEVEYKPVVNPRRGSRFWD